MENLNLGILCPEGIYTKLDLLRAVTNETELGLMYIEMHMTFLKWLLNDESEKELKL